jgi:hypothetical protein
MGLEQDILDDMGNQMAKEMDFHILADLLEDIGWTSVKLKRFHSRQNSVDVIEWLETNCTGEWKNLSTRFIFEKTQDAEWFILRWQ